MVSQVLLGDGGRAIDAKISYAPGITVNQAGELFIADRFNHRIRKVGLDKTIITITGNGYRLKSGYGDVGDGQAATKASLNEPTDVNITPDGFLFIADMNNYRVRLVSPSDQLDTLLKQHTIDINNAIKSNHNEMLERIIKQLQSAGYSASTLKNEPNSLLSTLPAELIENIKLYEVGLIIPTNSPLGLFRARVALAQVQKLVALIRSKNHF